MNKKSKILIIFNFIVLFSYGQTIQNLQGIWITNYEDLLNIKIFKENKYFDFSYFKKENKAMAFTDPYGYWGFYEGLEEPKKLSDLSNKGNGIRFYSHLNHSYDVYGNLLGPDIHCSIVMNENIEQVKEPKTMSLYFRGTPDVYEKKAKVPDDVLLVLKKNKSDWQKFVDFVGMKEKRITSEKTIIYNTSKEPTKMYLLKNDVVEVLEERGDWVRFNYYGKRVVTGWIKKSDLN